MANDWKPAAESDVRALVVKHVDLFSRGDCERMPQETFQAPVWVGSNPVRMLAVDTDVTAFFERVISAIREKGRDYSDVLNVDVRLFSRQSAVADLTYRRFRKDGSVMGDPNSRASYLAMRTEQGWRLTALLPVRSS